ncbi:MAG TPA: RimK family protein [Mariprofundaceae bacterium]|nr:RimK family protein [Mariprofundaceae bacterium]
MARYAIVVDRRSDWKWNIEEIDVLTANDYLVNKERPTRRPSRIINLCRFYTYLTAGYYCSLLAEARGEVPMPTVADILDLSKRSLYAFALPDLNRLLESTQKRLAEPPLGDFELYIFFGIADDRRFNRFAAEVFDLFRYPLLSVQIRKGKAWQIRSIKPMGLHQVPDSYADFFESSLRAYTRLTKRRRTSRKPSALYDLAILYNPNEGMSPSNEGALKRFIQAGEALRVDVELLQARDYHRISEYDALFLRETTALNHHTFRFARKAEAEGIPVIDDSKSILRCTNKVYLAELLAKNKLPAPKTVILNRHKFDNSKIAEAEAVLGYPMVLKIPDGSFSRGMYKANNRAEAVEAATKLFEHSRLILAQEFMPTDYDWRIGILNGKPIFACQYLMARKHWQIVNHKADGKAVVGGFHTYPVSEAPAQVVEIATKAASLIGNSLYGVDLKQNERGIFVIEVNDNPNIDNGVEDKVLKGELYTTIIQEFIRRIDISRTA